MSFPTLEAPPTTAPAPGSGRTTSAAACTPATPCFVCRLRQAVAAQGVRAGFSGRPFELNLLGIRRANEVTDKFDDLLAFFMALPAAESRQALLDASIEEALIADVNRLASKLDGSVQPWRSIRRVACSDIPSADGRPTVGDWVVGLIPITTDPGLVRLQANHVATRDAAKAKVATIEAELSKIDGYKRDYATAYRSLNDDGRALKDMGVPKRGVPKSAERLALEEKVRTAQAGVDAIRTALKFGKIDLPAFDKRIESRREELKIAQTTAQTSVQSLIDAWNADPALTRSETSGFDYRWAFRNENGDIEGDSHAYFPLGHRPAMFRMGLHHWSKDNALPALTVGEYIGDRVLTGALLAREFHGILEQAVAVRVGEVQAEVARRTKEVDAAHAAHVASLSAKERKAQRDVLAARLADARTEAQAPLRLARRECLPLVRTRRSRQPVPAGALVMFACAAETPDGRRLPLPDAAVVRLAESPGRDLAVREVRMHHRALMAIARAAGRKALVLQSCRLPAPGGADDFAGTEVPAGSLVVQTDLVYDTGSAQWPVDKTDILLVQARAGGTNVHRGHPLDWAAARTGVVSAKKHGDQKVGNWSTGCQVVPFFDDFNLLILLAGLSKRVRCVATRGRHDCPRIEAGTAAAPDAFVREHALVNGAEVVKADAPLKPIVGEAETAQKQCAELDKALLTRADAWFKAHPAERRPAVAAERPQALRALLLQRRDAAAAAEAALAPRETAAVAPGAPAAPAAPLPPARAAARARREALQQELDTLDAALAQRGAVQARLAELAAALDMLALPGVHSYRQVDEWIDRLDATIAARLADAAQAPAGSSQRNVLREVRAVIPALREESRLQAHARGVTMRHDWMRRCDLGHSHGRSATPLACGTQAAGGSCTGCAQTFDYTLIELAGGNDTPAFDSLAEVQLEFAKTTRAGDAYPRWAGFGA